MDLGLTQNMLCEILDQNKTFHFTSLSQVNLSII